MFLLEGSYRLEQPAVGNHENESSLMHPLFSFQNVKSNQVKVFERLAIDNHQRDMNISLVDHWTILLDWISGCRVDQLVGFAYMTH